ncbi:gamma-glutamyltranspeptidase [Sphaerisporangium rufum]|uniref:Gamma-glutamyltranspeptidase n=1 Tax=Sphaerisporangium rufum TaxID=1381558 RepID=A0A919R399_9ACTN|nr:gamma-glutamyltransferase [Sphaerisporangium rufum]GII77611.1 gamma-glutamyltranspeptidase [Sphaerisporangium rufum]
MRSHRPGRVAVSRRRSGEGTVVGPHESSVQAGLRILELGGNAVDAAVAAALVAGVVEPTETTLAGCGFMLYNDGGNGPIAADFGPRAPLAASTAMFRLTPDAESSAVLGLAPVVDDENVNGPLAPGVPRTLLGLLTAHERWGRLDRRTVCRPAIEAAYNGFAADAWFLTSALSDLDRLRRDEAAARTFLDDTGLPIGHRSSGSYGFSFDTRPRVVQSTLGRTLEEVAGSSLDTLTTGAVAQRLVATARDVGGLLSLEDLRAAAPEIGPALTMRYRDVDVSVPPAPGGGITELEILAGWQSLNPEPSTSHESGEQTRRLALMMRHAFADRYHWLGDPAVVPVPTRELLSARYARDLARLVEAGTDLPRWGDGAPWLTYASVAAHDPWAYSETGAGAPEWSPKLASTPTGGTTHISATDRDGGTVAITHTAANHFGSGILCPRTGLLFDSAMAWFNAAAGAANSVRPGARALANMGPALITRAGRPVAAVGASGGRRIISAVAQLIINMVDGRLGPAEALALPRLDASGQKILVHEGRAEHLEALADLGATLVPSSNEPFTMDFARPNVAGHPAAGQSESAIPTSAYGD